MMTWRAQFAMPYVEDGIVPVKRGTSQFKAGAYTRPLFSST